MYHGTAAGGNLGTLLFDQSIAASPIPSFPVCIQCRLAHGSATTISRLRLAARLLETYSHAWSARAPAFCRTPIFS